CAVGKPAGEQLAEDPDDRVDGRDQGDLPDAGAVRCEVERRQPPGESVVQVVDQPGLAARPETRVADTRPPEGCPQVERPASVITMLALLVSDVRTRVAHREQADQQAGSGDNGRADPDDGAWRVTCRQGAARKGGERDAQVARSF